MKKIAIIGSNGFLSNSILNYISNADYDVSLYGLSDYNCDCHHKFIRIDLTNDELDYEDLAKNGLIIYCVGAGIQSNLNESVDLIYSLNVMQPIKICKALSKICYSGTFVSFGSYFEIGENADDIQFSEQDVANSILSVPNEYCISKRLLTRFVQSNTPSFKHLHMILPTIYGAGEANHRLIPYVLNAISKGIEPELTSGEQKRQYIFINDVVEIMFSLVVNGADGLVNIVGKDTLSVKELVNMIYCYKGITMPDSIFQKAQRADVSMNDLQLCNRNLNTFMPHYKFTSVLEAIISYE